MALQVTKSVSLQGNSMIENQVVVFLNANISEETAGQTTVNQIIQEPIKYRENIAQCRNDIQAFRDKVYAVEDELMKEMNQKKASKKESE